MTKECHNKCILRTFSFFNCFFLLYILSTSFPFPHYPQFLTDPLTFLPSHIHVISLSNIIQKNENKNHNGNSNRDKQWENVRRARDLESVGPKSNIVNNSSLQGSVFLKYAFLKMVCQCFLFSILHYLYIICIISLSLYI